VAEDDVTLPAFLSRAASRGFAWGRHDCMMFAADWAACLGRDPAQGWRGSYADEAGAAAILERAGGSRAHMQATLGPCGWWPISAGGVRAGDIVLAHPPQQLETAGIATNRDRVAFVTRRGLVVWRARIVAAWRHSGLTYA
jgi:hypothetical protein